jgi:IS30 family transposase
VKLKKAKTWSDEDLNKLKEMKREGFSIREIAEDLGRTKTAVAQRLTKINGDKGPKRKYTKRNLAHKGLAPSAPTPVARPMLALVGTHSEITNAIKELFS